MITTIALVVLATAVAFLWMWVAWIAKNLPKVFDASFTVGERQAVDLKAMRKKVARLASEVRELKQRLDELGPEGDDVNVASGVDANLTESSDTGKTGQDP